MNFFDPESQYRCFGGGPAADPCRPVRPDPCCPPPDPCRCPPPGPCGPGPCGADAWYFGHPDQVVPSGGDLVFSRYFPDRGGPAPAPAAAAKLPCGVYLVSWAVNASASLSLPVCAGGAAQTAAGEEQLRAQSTFTVGAAPVVNGSLFPRGGSFATIPFSVGDTYSAPLAAAFVVFLPNAVNTLGLRNTASAALPTDYQLLSLTALRVG